MKKSTQKLNHNSASWKPVFLDKRVACNHKSHYVKFSYLWKSNYIRAGERCGPAVTHQAIEEAKSKHGSDLSPLECVEILIKERGDSMHIEKLYDQMLPLAEAKDEADKRRAQLSAASRDESKQRKIRAMDQKIAEALPEAEWKQHALGSLLLERSTEHLRKAPSKATNKAVGEVVNKVTDAFEKATKSQFLHSFQGLSPDDPFEEALLRSLQQHAAQRWELLTKAKAKASQNLRTPPKAQNPQH